jgi:DNA-binding CsgD family transcriptional regulator
LCRALVAADDEAEPDYQLAVDQFQQCRVAPSLARAQLLYGEWLRRQRRRRDAREQLNAAWRLFDKLGMAAFAERARVELRATGEQAPKHDEAPREALTPQEAQIARLAAEGWSNPEIATRLFISASTVDYHLRKVYRKLGITGRGRLARVLAGTDETPQLGN